jgi:hypothetical protein
MGGVALVESVSTEGKATNLTGHLYSGYEAKDYNLVGNKLLRKRAAAAMLDIHTRATLSVGLEEVCSRWILTEKAKEYDSD